METDLPRPAGPPAAFMSSAGRRFMDSLSSIPRFAHHPDCPCYDSHVLRIGGHVLCLGCTCMAAGMIVATCLLGAVWISGLRGPVGWPAACGGISLGLALYLPTLVQPFWQRKAFKMSARLLLGVAVVVLLAAGLLLSPWNLAGIGFRCGFITTFWLVYRATLRYREMFTPDPCDRCSPAVYPFCVGNRNRVVASLAELKQAAGPEDAEFVAFASALAGERSEVAVEITSLRAIAGFSASTCHRS